MPMISFLVSKLEKQTLSNLVTHCFGSDFPDILHKPQVDYIYNYLHKMGAVSVLLEPGYVDKDYLEDFSRYYVKRFGNAGHQCARMHFFTQNVDHQLVDRILEGQDGAEQLAKELNESYLGFTVIKPLPKTFIGKTCLKVMSDTPLSDGKLKRRLSREYKVDLFGIELSVTSIAFQEQDKVVAACASTSIWSALHTLAWREVRGIHSCSEITVNAINHIDGSSNSFPNKELSNKQILRSLDVEGLRHHSENLKAQQLSEIDFLATVIGHIDSHLPLLVMGAVYAVGEENKLISYRAGHAVCILGYKVDSEKVVYVHDDRLGPYARAKLVKLCDYDCGTEQLGEWALGLQRVKEGTDEWEDPHELIVPEFLVMPTDKKARLPFFYAHYTGQFIVNQFPELLGVISPNPPAGGMDLSHTVTLREISTIRREIRKQIVPQTHVEPLTGAVFQVEPEDYAQWQKDKITFLTSSFARLQWEVQIYYKSEKAFRVFIDASDIPQGNAVSAIFVDDISLSAPILKIFRKRGFYDQTETAPMHFYQSFLSRLLEKEETLEDYLDVTYGALRAPIKLKAQEFLNGRISSNPTRQVIRDPVASALCKLHTRFDESGVHYLIWAIAEDGALLIGEEIYLRIEGREEPCGHPSITKFRPARIAGELWRVEGGWHINPWSGRYSGDYDSLIELLGNALLKFKSFFPLDKFEIEPLPPKSKHLMRAAYETGVRVNSISTEEAVEQG